MITEHVRQRMVDADRRGFGRHCKSHACGRQAGGEAKKRFFKDPEPRLRQRNKGSGTCVKSLQNE